MFGFNLATTFANAGTCGFQYNTCLGSTKEGRAVDLMYLEFQYNTCLGSTVVVWKVGFSKVDFNTTLVWVQLNKRLLSKRSYNKFQYNTCLGSTILEANERVHPETFQYNTCLGSTLGKRLAF